MCPGADHRQRASGGPRVLILGAHGFTNVGDDAILAAMLTELRAALPGATFVVPTRDAAVAVVPDATAVPFDDRAIRAALAETDLLIIGGGGLLFDFRDLVTYGEFFGGRATVLHALYRAAIVAHGHGIPIHLYAVGVGPLVGAAARGLTRTLCALASAITVRDSFSRRELLGLGVADEKIAVTADPTVGLPAPAARRDGDATRVGFAIRDWFPVTASGAAQLPHGPAYLARYLDSCAAAADRVVSRWGGRAIFFAVQRELDDDRDFARRVIARMARPEGAMIVAAAGDYQGLQSLLGGLDLVVSTRLHGLIFAASAGVLGVGINLNTKVRAFLCDLGLPELAVSPWDGRMAILAETIDRVLASPADYAARLAAGMAAQQRAAARNPAISAALLAPGAG